MFKGPRVSADFKLVERLVRSGIDEHSIQRMFLQSNEWRSEVETLAGRLHCSHCNQFISLHECLNCGQTINEGINI